MTEPRTMVGLPRGGIGELRLGWVELPGFVSELVAIVTLLRPCIVELRAFIGEIVAVGR
jgi:hypothetical protein